jgi:hypothetical protein
MGRRPSPVCAHKPDWQLAPRWPVAPSRNGLKLLDFVEGARTREPIKDTAKRRLSVPIWRKAVKQLELPLYLSTDQVFRDAARNPRLARERLIPAERSIWRGAWCRNEEERSIRT